MAFGMAREMSPANVGYAENEERPVDLVHLAQHSLGNRQLEQEILRLFVRQSAIYLDRLKAAASTDARCKAAHTIKGSARGIGAWRVAHLAEAIENPPAADYAMAFDLMKDLEKAVDEANRFIASLIKDN
ncbi:MAG: Hpt domain-containing protein [Hyphomicrobiales bacterium]|nr:Hpt domain-containing protein [Hyphomicrobiales bacterium]